MSALEADEITPGLNVFLDVGLLEICPGVETNARFGTRVDSTKLRPFLVIELMEDGRCLCTPLFSEPAIDRLKLTGQKSGPGSGWTGRSSYFSRFQFWKMPLACVEKASHRERSGNGQRQRYAENDLNELVLIGSHRCDSDAGYSSISN
jgi:hypothetical protein